MTSAREEILVRLESANPAAPERPVERRAPEMPVDPIACLRDRLDEAGGSLQIADRLDWPNQIVWPVDLSKIEHLYSALPAIQAKGVGASATSDHDLDSLDLCVASADFAVVENGAVWQRPTTARERAAMLLANHLILVVEASQLVATLHQAYDRIGTTSPGFGWFLCGPSKTADIEQSLVLGAHGPCSMNLILLRDQAAPPVGPPVGK